MPRTGLEHLRAIIAGEVPVPPMSLTLSFRIVAADEGFAAFEGDTQASLANPMGQVHGGWACTLLDSAMGSAVMSTLPAGVAYATAQLNVNLTRAILIDTGHVRAEARIVHRGKRMATAEGTLRDAKGALLAHGTTTCMILT
jgi:uncharacterized protein (TIGR00369 family)